MNPIFITANEQDAESLAVLGITAVENPFHIPVGSQVIIISCGDPAVDANTAEELWMRNKPSRLKLLCFPVPFSNWVSESGSLEGLQAIAKTTSEWKPMLPFAEAAAQKPIPNPALIERNAVIALIPDVENMLLEGSTQIEITAHFQARGVDPSVIATALSSITDPDTGSLPHGIAGVPAISGTKPEAFYYEKYKKEYLLRNNRGAWLCLAESQFKKELASRGIDSTKGKRDLVSEIDAKLIYLRGFHDIDYASSLAGHDEGFYESNGQRILVTDSPRIPSPVEGQWPILRAYLEGLFVDGEYDQLCYFMGWLKIAYTSLRAHSRRPGQALVLCGPRNCGKSLLQQLITIILGGRIAKPYAFMTDTTSFNADLFQAEHLCIDDEPATTDLRSRRAFGAQIKQITACDTQRCHAKGKQALTLSPFWRLTISLNDESENLMVLPPVDDSIADKLIILRTCRPASGSMPMSTASGEERSAFWKTLVSELPAFLHYVTHWTITPDLSSQRYGIAHFHHPALLEELDALSPEFRLLNIIDGVLFSTDIPLIWNGTSQDLEIALTSNDRYSYDARRLLSWNTACGVYLARLARKCPSRFIETRSKNNRAWIINPPPADTPADASAASTTG